MFEPFLQDQPLNFVLANGGRETHTQCQPYVQPGAATSAWTRDLQRVLRGRIRHKWCDRFTQPGVYFRRVIKTVRMNLMLDFVATRWPKLKILFIVRDPRSVVNSQLAKMKQGWDMRWRPEFALGQPQLMANWLEPYRELIEACPNDAVHQQTIKWCVENLPPFALLRQHDNVLMVSYDRLVENSHDWDAVSDFLHDRNWQPDRFRAAVDEISRTAERTARDIRSRNETWPELDDVALRQVCDIVREFGLSHALHPDRRQNQAA